MNFVLSDQELAWFNNDSAMWMHLSNELLVHQINHDMVDAPMERAAVGYYRMCSRAISAVARYLRRHRLIPANEDDQRRLLQDWERTHYHLPAAVYEVIIGRFDDFQRHRAELAAMEQQQAALAVAEGWD